MNVIQELHQFEDGLRPAQPSPAHDWDGEKWALGADKVALLEQQEAERLCVSVDAAADSARNLLAGDPLKSMEYAQAAADAQAFLDEGYPKKEVPLSVAAWVVKGRTAKQAADQILGKATQLTEHLLTLRTLRLKAKAQIKAHVAKGNMELARDVSEAAIVAIRNVVNDSAR
ncbi:phage tail protein [Pseudomonas sp. N3-W]|uniref:Phage tail protein n=1 Tax=Pseudomonas fungipugnans TaxID=3024217 RepID=A0ABT6QTC2_9PSED|nr:MULTISPECIES: phage tail protein [unclassified Pseudomonas]MDI2594162.1 phage tail protein [Pseudomonas sp. 681]UWF50550.1 phage tail protein [Pseudomonas sp. N3-W]